MKINPFKSILPLIGGRKTAIPLAALLLLSFTGTAHAQGTAFTYQGRLQDNGSPANGVYDLRFEVWDALTSGTLIAGPITNSATGVTNGLFAVTLDFGPGVFSGLARWLQLGVRAGGGAFTTLSPRQELTPTPYSIMANTASNLVGTLPATQLSGTVGNGQLANSSITVTAGAGLGGGGTVALGGSTTLNNAGVLSVAGNADITAITLGGAVTLGDTATSANTPSTIVKRDGSGSFSATNVTLNGTLNMVNANDNTGVGQRALANDTTGYYNTANGYNALYSNTTGNQNTANGATALANNTSGSFNTANGVQALAYNTAGFNNTANGAQALFANTNGNNNTANGYNALLNNTSGSGNIALGSQAGENITAGNNNIDIGNPGLAGDNSIIRIGDGQSQTFIAGVINGDGTSLTNVSVSGLTIQQNTNGAPNVIAGSPVNFVSSGAVGATIGGGGATNYFSGPIKFISPHAYTNSITADFGTVGGGANNTAGYQATVGGGENNTASEDLATVGGGLQNTASSYGATVGGGWGNQATNNYATVPGGSSNLAGGLYSFAAGQRAQALHQGSFVWADAQAADFASATSNQFLIRASGGVRLVTSGAGLNVDGSPVLTLLPTSVLTNNQSGVVLSGAFSGDGTGLTNVNASQLTSIGNTNGGLGNFFVGPSGSSTTIGSDNTANGFTALYNNTSGSDNTANGAYALISNTSGSENTANGAYALFSNTSGSENAANGVDALYLNTSGSYNTASGFNALGLNTNGSDNTASGVDALYLNTSGSYNTANGFWALENNTSGSNNIAVGYLAGSSITGSYNIDIGNPGLSTDTNIIRIGSGQTATYLVGTVYANGVALTSDRNAKENFTTVNAREVLAKVASLPVTEWNFKTDSKDVQHIGPTAQDFQAAFQLSADDKHIAVVDEGGVALAAIQGLNQKLEETQQEVKAKDAEIQNLEEKLHELQAVVNELAAQK